MMRQAMATLLVLAILLVLTGCSTVAQPAQGAPGTTAANETVAEPPAAVDNRDSLADSNRSGDKVDAALEPRSSEVDGPTIGEEAEDESLVDIVGGELLNEQTAATDGRPLDETTNILLLGSDRRPDTPNWRTDVLMIIALDRENGRAGVISIPRDVFIEEIPNHKPNRVNVVDYLGELDEPDGGGPALLASIIERDMGIPIDHYLRFSFDSFREVVDALDGVPVDIDCEFSGYIEDEGGWLVLEPGMHRLTGNQAMIYVRDRQLTGGDLNRARRQQRFVWAVRNQILDENLIGRVPALYSALAGSVDTDIGLVTTLQLARLALALDPEDLYGMVLAPPDLLEEGWALGMSVFLPDWAAIAENVQTVFDSPPFLTNNTPENCR